MSKLEEVLDSLARNERFGRYDIGVVMVPHEHVRMLQRKYFEQKAAISADRRLTNDGKELAVEEARAKRDAAEALQVFGRSAHRAEGHPVADEPRRGGHGEVE